MIDRAPFDPGDAFDAMADRFRREVADIALRAEKTTIFREMPTDRQVACFMAGVTTGLVGVCFAFVDREGRDPIVRALADYLPQAAENAESIADADHGKEP